MKEHFCLAENHYYPKVHYKNLVGAIKLIKLFYGCNKILSKTFHNLKNESFLLFLVRLFAINHNSIILPSL